MADRFGALALPAPVPTTADEAVTDPTLDAIGSFCTAVLRAQLHDAWQTRAPGQQVVTRYFTHDLKKHDFNANTLPALYCWREKGASGRNADGLLVSKTPISLVWIFQPAKQAIQSVRDPIISGWTKALAAAFERGRHPAWRSAADTDPTSARRGSTFPRAAGIARLAFRDPEPIPIEILMEDGSFRIGYDAIRAFLDIEEELTRDGATYPMAVPSALELEVTREDGTIAVERHLFGDYSSAFSSAFYGGQHGGFDQSFDAGFH